MRCRPSSDLQRPRSSRTLQVCHLWPHTATSPRSVRMCRTDRTSGHHARWHEESPLLKVQLGVVSRMLAVVPAIPPCNTPLRQVQLLYLAMSISSLVYFLVAI